MLLKNDGPVLPLDPSKSTAIIGLLGDSAHDMLGPVGQAATTPTPCRCSPA